jgi:hypothetical protein
MMSETSDQTQNSVLRIGEIVLDWIDVEEL